MVLYYCSRTIYCIYLLASLGVHDEPFIGRQPQLLLRHDGAPLLGEQLFVDDVVHGPPARAVGREPVEEEAALPRQRLFNSTQPPAPSGQGSASCAVW